MKNKAGVSMRSLLAGAGTVLKSSAEEGGSLVVSTGQLI